MKLMRQGLMKLLAGLILVGMMLFWPAGTWAWWNAWLFIAILFIPMLLLGATLLVKAPDLLRKRLSTREKRGAQQGIVAAAALMFVGAFVLAGLDFRFGWSGMARGVSLTAAVVQLIAYGLYAEVMRENAYLSRTIEIQQGQQVVDTGLYGVVRHPMYMATILLFLAMPLVLGSWWAFAVMLLYPAAVVRRIADEETLLSAELAGYEDYRKKVRYRLIPYIW